MRLTFAQLNMAFFFGPVSATQNSFETFESVTRRPRMTLIRPLTWDSAEALAAMDKAKEV